MKITNDTYHHMGIEPPSIPLHAEIHITLNKAFKLWQQSGKRCTFENSLQVLKFLGYRIL